MLSTGYEGTGNIIKAEIFGKIFAAYVITTVLRREKCETQETKRQLCEGKLLLIPLVTVDLTHHWVTSAACQGKWTIFNSVYMSVNVMFWINPSHFLHTGFIYHLTRCQETVMRNVQYMHLQHYLQLQLPHIYSYFILSWFWLIPLYFAEPWDFPPTSESFFTASHTLFILPGINCRSNVPTGTFISEW